MSDNRCKTTLALIKYFHRNHSHCISSRVPWDIQKCFINPMFTNGKTEWNNDYVTYHFSGIWDLKEGFVVTKPGFFPFSVMHYIYFDLYLFAFYTHTQIFLCHRHSIIFLVQRGTTWLKIILIIKIVTNAKLYIHLWLHSKYLLLKMHKHPRWWIIIWT